MSKKIHITPEENLELITRAIEQSASVIMITDARGHIEYVNQQFCTTTGYSKEEVVGQNPKILKSGKTSPAEYKKLWETITTGEEWRGEMVNRKKDGTYYWVHETISPVCNADGVITHFAGVQEDYTKQKELEEAKDNFVSSVSHELRTPLTVIGLSLENLETGLFGSLNKKQLELVERSVRNTHRLGKLIDNLLGLSRLQSSRTKIERKNLDLNQLFHEVIENFQANAKENNIVFQEELEKNLPPAKGDFELISQVLTNLVSNALRYATKKIIVKMELVSLSDKASPFIQVSVSNDGPAIPSEKLNQLFEKFSQLDRENRKGAYKGTGLGLAICKEILARHHGKIWAENSGESGVTFYFTLPTQEAPPHEAPR